MANHEPPAKPGETPGYPEKHPRDKEDAQKPHPRKRPNPDEGGLDRDPDQDGRPDDT